MSDQPGKANQGTTTGSTRPPPVDFSGFVVSMAQAALVHLGEIPDPITGEINRDIEQARYSIDLIDMLAEKTKGNLSREEENLVRSVLVDLKMRYVRAK